MSQMPAPPPPNAPAPAFDPGQLPPPPPPPGAAAPPAASAPSLTLVPATPAPPAAPAAAPATPAPAVPAPAPAPAPAAPVHVLLPTDTAAALDMGIPLGHAMAAPDATPSVISEPRAFEAGRPATDPVAERAPEPAPAASHVQVVDVNRQWWSPANALVLAVAALTWQFISFYAREQLPGVKASGAELRGFDRLVETLPLAGTSAGRVVGVVLAAVALAVVLHGIRRGLREPVIQGIVAVVAVLSLALIAVLPALVG